jgi:hypothetical protein
LSLDAERLTDSGFTTFTARPSIMVVIESFGFGLRFSICEVPGRKQMTKVADIAQLAATIAQNDGGKSRLFQEIREKRGLVYAIYSLDYLPLCSCTIVATEAHERRVYEEGKF